MRMDLVDVFGAQRWRGNPVAVVHDAGTLDTQQMQELARWLDLSETVFLLPSTVATADYRARIFTPAQELPFAGHPTLGAAHAVADASGGQHDRLVQECGVGQVELRRIDGNWAFAGPPLRAEGPLDDDLRPRLAAVLGVPPEHVDDASWADNGPPWIAVEVTAADLSALRPDASRDPAGGSWFVAAFAGGGDTREVRAWFPDATGRLREDPATGSLAAALGQLLVSRGELAEGGTCTLRQGEAVGASARLLLHPDEQGRVWVAGTTRTVVRGTLAGS